MWVLLVCFCGWKNKTTRRKTLAPLPNNCVLLWLQSHLMILTIYPLKHGPPQSMCRGSAVPPHTRIGAHRSTLVLLRWDMGQTIWPDRHPFRPSLEMPGKAQ
jgi:hypothetical protein